MVSEQRDRATVLDHGYVKVIEWWGSDERIIEAARMSTNKGFMGWGTDGAPGDEKLLRFLYTHHHMSPFEMAGVVIEVQAPIFVFREWHRHRTQSYNELSARYTPMPDVHYVPSVERILANGGSNKQAQSTGAAIDEAGAIDFQKALIQHYAAGEALYRVALGAAGVPKELARLCIPVGRYSRMRASANLRNWLHFLTLRLDPAAQWEIRQYAEVVGRVIGELFPRTWGLFAESKRG